MLKFDKFGSQTTTTSLLLLLLLAIGSGSCMNVIGPVGLAMAGKNSRVPKLLVKNRLKLCTICYLVGWHGSG